MFCKYCGNEVADNMKFCTKCGKPIQNAQAAPSGQRTKKNKVVVPLAAPGQQQQMRPNPVGQSNQQPEPKKKNGALIALIVVVALLVVAVVILAVVFFSGRISTGSTENTMIEQSDDDDQKEDDQDKDKNKKDNEDDGDEDSDKQTLSDGDEPTDGVDNGEVAKKDTSEKEDEDELFRNNSKKDTKDATEDTEEDEDMIFQGDNDDYVLPDSSTRRLTAADLEEIADDKELLRIARNEIYARHHRRFADANPNQKPLQPYFDSKEWYDGYIEPEDFTDDMLSKIERDNIKLIQEYEAKL